MGVSRSYRAKLAKYKGFVDDGWPLAQLDWGEHAAMAVFLWESTGADEPPNTNGYKVGKRWLDWQVDEWRNGLIGGTIIASELRNDPALSVYAREVEAVIRAVFGENV